MTNLHIEEATIFSDFLAIFKNITFVVKSAMFWATFETFGLVLMPISWSHWYFYAFAISISNPRPS